ncbi:MAG: tryptophan-rich sensory protein, partial [Hyphomicrobiales bacterium]|nr:tryptophan-rich sensory protein [Hyphomicrobiales bacterium]
FVPPNFVFAMIWIAVYLLMAFALGRILSMPKETPGRRAAILLFLAQLALNMLWTFLFFGLHSPLLGLAAIVAQLLCVGAAIAAFRPLDTQAALALAPLAAWLAFVALTNYEIVLLN